MSAKLEVILSVIDRGTKQLDRVEGNIRRFAVNTKTSFTQLANVQNLILGSGAVYMGKSLLDAQIKMDGLRSKLKAALGPASDVGGELARLRNEADAMGQNVVDLTEGFANFSAAATRSGFSLDQTRTMFRQVSEAAISLKLPGENVQNVFRALQQIASKGTVSMEELRLQLSDHLPGALAIAAKSMNMTQAEFQKAVRSGDIMARDFLPKFTKQLREDLGGALEEAANSTQANLNRMANSWMDFKTTISPVVSWLLKQSVNVVNATGKIAESAGMAAGGYWDETIRVKRFIDDLLASETDQQKQLDALSAKRQEVLKSIEQTEAAIAKIGKPKKLFGVIGGEASAELEMTTKRLWQLRMQSEMLAGQISTISKPASPGVAGGTGTEGQQNAADELAKINDRIAGRMEKLRNELASVNLEIETDQLKHDAHIVDALVQRASEVGWIQVQMTELEKKQAEERQEIAEQEYQMKRRITTSMISLGEQMASVAIGSMFSGNGEDEKKQAKKRAVAYFAVANMAAAASIWTDKKASVYEKIGESIGVGAGLTASLITSLATADKYARGTTFAHGGMAVVGEEGPELANLPRGSQVYSAAQSRGMTSGAPVFNMTFNGPVDQSTLPAIRGDLQAFGRKMMNAVRYGAADFGRLSSYPS